MKKSSHPILIALACWLMPASVYSADTDSLGLPGDNFDLYGAMEVFKNSKSLEDFEKELNTEKNGINNLDLNGDDEIDYVRVVDHMDGDAHAITIEVPVSETESQSIAVFEIEKTGDENAGLQLVGDEDMYGADYIIEPYEEEQEKSTEMPFAAPRVRIVVNVWAWRPIRFIYAPRYTVWVSPWRWGAYPRWYRPWRPVRWRVHHNHCRRYRVHHVHRVHVHRHTRAHKVYHTHRTRSVVVHRNQPHKKSNTKVVKKSNSKAAVPKQKQASQKANHNTTRRQDSQTRSTSKKKTATSRAPRKASGQSRASGGRSKRGRR